MTLEEITNEYIKSLSDDDYVQGEEKKIIFKKKFENNIYQKERMSGVDKYTYEEMKRRILKVGK